MFRNDEDKSEIHLVGLGSCDRRTHYMRCASRSRRNIRVVDSSADKLKSVQTKRNWRGFLDKMSIPQAKISCRIYRKLFSQEIRVLSSFALTATFRNFSIERVLLSSRVYSYIMLKNVSILKRNL